MGDVRILIVDNICYEMKEMTTREVQMVSLDILKDVHDFCVKNNIKYSLCGGTLIGAIRHNGFIPWDDDVDIVMPRPEYERFIHAYKSEKGYKLFSPEVASGTPVRIRLSKVCDMERTVMDNGAFVWTNVVTGVGIDIIPAEGAPDNEVEAKKQIEGLTRYSHIASIYRSKFSSYSEVRKYIGIRRKIKFVVKKILGVFYDESIFIKFINFQKRYDYDSSSHFCAGFTYGMGEWQSKEIFEEFVLHRFEDSEFFVTAKYDQYLRSLFGDYMQIPPKEKRIPHFFFKYYWK